MDGAPRLGAAVRRRRGRVRRVDARARHRPRLGQHDPQRPRPLRQADPRLLAAGDQPQDLRRDRVRGAPAVGAVRVPLVPRARAVRLAALRAAGGDRRGGHPRDQPRADADRPRGDRRRPAEPAADPVDARPVAPPRERPRRAAPPRVRVDRARAARQGPRRAADPGRRGRPVAVHGARPITPGAPGQRPARLGVVDPHRHPLVRVCAVAPRHGLRRRLPAASQPAALHGLARGPRGQPRLLRRDAAGADDAVDAAAGADRVAPAHALERAARTLHAAVAGLRRRVLLDLGHQAAALRAVRLHAADAARGAGAGRRQAQRAHRPVPDDPGARRRRRRQPVDRALGGRERARRAVPDAAVDRAGRAVGVGRGADRPARVRTDDLGARRAPLPVGSRGRGLRRDAGGLLADHRGGALVGPDAAGSDPHPGAHGADRPVEPAGSPARRAMEVAPAQHRLLPRAERGTRRSDQRRLGLEPHRSAVAGRPRQVRGRAAGAWLRAGAAGGRGLRAAQRTGAAQNAAAAASQAAYAAQLAATAEKVASEAAYAASQAAANVRLQTTATPPPAVAPSAPAAAAVAAPHKKPDAARAASVSPPSPR